MLNMISPYSRFKLSPQTLVFPLHHNSRKGCLHRQWFSPEILFHKKVIQTEPSSTFSSLTPDNIAFLCRQFEVRYFQLGELVLQNVSERTGCLPPCVYTEYRITKTYDLVS